MKRTHELAKFPQCRYFNPFSDIKVVEFIRITGIRYFNLFWGHIPKITIIAADTFAVGVMHQHQNLVLGKSNIKFDGIYAQFQGRLE